MWNVKFKITLKLGGCFVDGGGGFGFGLGLVGCFFFAFPLLHHSLPNHLVILKLIFNLLLF